MVPVNLIKSKFLLEYQGMPSYYIVANNVRSVQLTDNELCQLLWCTPHPQLFPSPTLIYPQVCCLGSGTSGVCGGP